MVQRMITVKEPGRFSKGIEVANDEYSHPPQDREIPAKIDGVITFAFLVTLLVLPFWLL